jgi:flagellar biosynthesis/type III secretory pathway M-ring protein FliF/YscJ
MTRLRKGHRIAMEVFMTLEILMRVILPIISVLSLFIGAPAIVFSFILRLKKSEEEAKRLQYQKEMLELEVKKEELQLRRLEIENKQYDRLINE